MPNYSLAADVHFAMSDGRSILLNESANRYFMLDPLTDEAFQRLVTEGTASMAVLGRLSALGVLSETPEVERPVAPLHLVAPIDSVLEMEDTSSVAAISAAPLALTYLIRAAWTCRHKQFGAVLAAMERVAARLPPTHFRTLDDLIAETRRFLSIRRMLPMRSQCLPDSWALFHFLAHRGFRTEMVIGVRGNPFNAHCWIQGRGILLNETADCAGKFEPIRLIS